MVHTLVPISEATNISLVKIAMEGRLEDILLQKNWETLPSSKLELSVFVNTGLGVWFVVCVVLLPRSWRLSFSCAGVVRATLALEIFLVRNS